MSLIILNFHGVGPITRKIGEGEFNCWLEQSVFEAVLELVRGQSNVRLTFDDGNVSDFEIAYPALLRREMRAAFFLCSGRLDQPGFLSRKQVCELLSGGMQIGSHGVDHRSWRKLNPEQLDIELNDSRQALEEICGRSVDMAACPFGDYDRRVLNGLHEAGYRKVYSSDGGSVTENQWIQARNTITKSMSLADIQRLVLRAAGTGGQFLIDLRKFLKGIRS